jgi:hypothetical protein
MISFEKLFIYRKEARKENKKKVKEEKREARKTKVPKDVKKRRKKLSKPLKTRYTDVICNGYMSAGFEFLDKSCNTVKDVEKK